MVDMDRRATIPPRNHFVTMPSDTSQRPAADSDIHLSDCQWLVFDAVGTLIDPDPTVAVAYHSVGSRFGSQFRVEDVGPRFRAAFRGSELDGFPGGPPAAGRGITSDAIEEARWRWIVRQVFSDVRDQEGCFRELWDHFARPSSWRCFADVGDALAQFAQAGYKLAIASNFDIRLHSVCDFLPAMRPIGRRVVSATVGFRKPAPEFYAAVIQACGCDPRQILMIGDNHEYVVLAPRATGLQALHLDRSRPSGGTDRLTSLTELAERLSGQARQIGRT